MKQNKSRVNVHEMDDDALEILYVWANNAILTHKPQCEKLITQILTEYEQRKTARQRGFGTGKGIWAQVGQAVRQ